MKKLLPTVWNSSMYSADHIFAFNSNEIFILYNEFYLQVTIEH